MVEKKWYIHKDWHKWFAWYPVKAENGNWYWWITIERQIEWNWAGSWSNYRIIKGEKN